jgi:NDP-sugar pyrophosphorylase family protein
LRLEGQRVLAIHEKPSESFLCNAGIYVLTPEALELVPPDTNIDMTDVIELAISRNHRVSVFPIHEYWTDIGNPADLETAMERFREAEHP